MKAVSIAAAACVACLASLAAHSKSACDIHRLGYTQAECDECSNMTWSISRVFPRGVCVSTTAPPASRIGEAPNVRIPVKAACDIHHLGYTKAQCEKCSNMAWSVSKVFPQGTCVSTARPQTLSIAGRPGTTPPSASGGASCTLTSWGGATIPLSSPNFSGTGVRVGVCAKGYDLARSQFQCSTGVPATAFNYPTTNVTCNRTTAVGGNPQVTINGRPCCLN